MAQLAFKIEVLQNGLRKKIIQIVKISATGDFDKALYLVGKYLEQLETERNNAEEAAILVRRILSGEEAEHCRLLKRIEVSRHLNIPIDTLRNWEMNGLLTVKRRENGYRVYTNEDIRRLKIIRSLRCANYSLEAILQMLCQLSKNPDVNILKALNIPKENADIIAAGDNLILSLFVAKCTAQKIITMLEEMKIKFS